MKGLFKTLGIVGLSAVAGGAAAYMADKNGFFAGPAGPQSSDHFTNEEVHEEPLDEEDDVTDNGADDTTTIEF